MTLALAGCGEDKQTPLGPCDATNWQHHMPNLKGCELTGANLQGAMMEGAELLLAKLDGSDLSQARLHGVKGAAASFVGADLSGADLSAAELRDAKFGEARLIGADLTDAKLSADLTDASLKGANLSRASLQYAYLARTDLTDALLDKTSFEDGHLVEMNLENFDLRSTSWSNAQVENSSLAGCDFTGVNPPTTMTEVDLSGAKLPKGFFYVDRWTKVNLKGIDLSQRSIDYNHPVITQSDLTDVNLSYAHLRRSHLGWNLTRTDLRGADIACVEFEPFDPMPWDAAITDKTTTCPNGLPGPCVRNSFALATWCETPDTTDPEPPDPSGGGSCVPSVCNAPLDCAGGFCCSSFCEEGVCKTVCN